MQETNLRLVQKKKSDQFFADENVEGSYWMLLRVRKAKRSQLAQALQELEVGNLGELVVNEKEKVQVCNVWKEVQRGEDGIRMLVTQKYFEANQVKWVSLKDAYQMIHYSQTFVLDKLKQDIVTSF